MTTTPAQAREAEARECLAATPHDAECPQNPSSWAFRNRRGVDVMPCVCGHAIRAMLTFAAQQSQPVGEGVLGVRPEVVAFALLMEQQLRANDHKPGWKEELSCDLIPRLREESIELEEATNRHAKRVAWGDGWLREDTSIRVGQEAADVANFAMMIADVCGALSATQAPVGEGALREALNLERDTLAMYREVLSDVDADYMTSEHHHPGYVLIPTAKFVQLRRVAQNCRTVIAALTPAADLTGSGEK